ncbi:DUF6336 family protein [Streptomyces aurantiacus]|uniref:DUF6336 family protein n=1 Tax=Streptomyces aurantiacus TaxID=47760 RepID=UPI00216AD987|nr:DUF6336 family protein [Streptomyces aurantiacus]
MTSAQRPDLDPTRDEEGVLLPRLRLKGVLGRGALFGVLANFVPLVGMCVVTEHHDRETFLAVVSGLGLIAGGFLLLIGLFFWSACGSDVRRWRDLRTITGQTEGLTIMAPACVRAGVVGLLLFPGPYGLYHLVDGAAFGSWLYGS